MADGDRRWPKVTDRSGQVMGPLRCFVVKERALNITNTRTNIEAVKVIEGNVGQVVQ